MKRVLFVLFLFPAVLFSQTQKLFTQFPLKNYIASDTGWIFLQADPLNGKVYKTPLSVLINSVNLSSTLPNGNYDDVSVYSNGVSILINDQKVTNNKLALSPPGTVKGNLSGATAPPTDNNQTALRNFLNYHSVASTGNYFDLINRPTIPANFNPIAGNLMTLSGTYPNITFSVSSDNTKQNVINLTTTGSTGAATLVGSTLNIPQYNLGSGSSQTLDQTLNFGNVTDTSIVQEDIDDITREIKPSNFNTSYGTAGVAKGFIEGVKSFADVNSPDSRPNVVYSFGYNVNINGARINSNEAAFRFGYETNYNINSDTARRGFEFHLPEITTKEGNQLRLWSMYVNKSGGYTELNSQIENTYFTKVSNGANWLTLNNSNVENVIHQYGNDSATVIYTAMTNPDTQAGRITTKYSPTGSDTYEYAIKADNPTGKLFTTNMSTRFDNSLLSTSFMNISNTSSTGTPSQPTLTLDHANSGSSKVQAWNYNASLIAEVDKDYSLMAYKPVLLYYGGLIYGDLTLNHSFGGNLRLVGFGSGTATKNLSIDASGYVIESDLIEPQTLDQTLELGNTTDTGIVFHLNYQNSDITQSYLFNPLVPNGTTVNKVIKRIRMSEYNAHADSLVGDWKEEIGEYEVNADGRKNVVWSWGYNIDQAKNDGYMRMGMESHYIVNNKPNFEWHAPEVMTKDGEINRWYSIIGRKDTASATHMFRGSTLSFLDIKNDIQLFGFDGTNWGMKGDFYTLGNPSNNTAFNVNTENNDLIVALVTNGGESYLNADNSLYVTADNSIYLNTGASGNLFVSNSFGTAVAFKSTTIYGASGSPFILNLAANGSNAGGAILTGNGSSQTDYYDMSLNMSNSTGNGAMIHFDNRDGLVSPLEFSVKANGNTSVVYVANVGSNGNWHFGSTRTVQPTASAQVEIESTTKGFLPPRMTKTQRDAISSPATGLVIYQTDNTPGLRCYNGTNWMRYTETAD